MQLRMIPFVVSLAMFMEAVDTTILNTAIPVMANSLHVPPIDLKIALISYLLSLAIFIPISGWLADKFGVKRVFIGALFIFTVSSCFCGMARYLPELVIARILQGIGGSLMLPVGRLIIVRTYQKHELLMAMNKVVTVGALGMMLGPMLGGFITHYFSWRWIFFVNIPVGLLGCLLAWYCLLDIKPQPVPPLDKIGFILFGSGLAVFTFGLSAFSESTFSLWNASMTMLGAIGLLGLYFLHSRQRVHPIINPQLFSFRTFRISALANVFGRVGFGGLPFLVPLLLQIGFGFSPQLSGLLLAPTAVGVIIAKPLSLHLLRLFGYKRCLMLNTFLMGVNLCLFIFIKQTTPSVFIAFFTFLFGFLSALQYTGMNSIAYSEIDHSYFSSATSFMSTLQQLSQSFGVAFSAIFIQIFSHYSFHDPLVTVRALHHTFIMMGVVTLLSILIFAKLKACDGLALLKKPI